MSSVRMCDNCGNIFSENDEGWTTFSGSRSRKREDGSRYVENTIKDACSPCSNKTFQPPALKNISAEEVNEKA